MRTPTPEERRKERAYVNTNIADSLIFATIIITAIVSGSLTMLGEAVRSCLMIIIDYLAIWVMLSVHRGRMRRYDFGPAKLEKLIWVIVGICFLIGAFSVAKSTITATMSVEPPASPFGLALAAVVNSVNLYSR